MARPGSLDIRHLTKTFRVSGRPLPVLADVSLTVAPGEFLSMVGPSGCGKSTLLRLIVGLDRDFRGEIRLDGQPVGSPSLDRAIVFQEHRLFPWLTAEANVALGLTRSAFSHADRRRVVAEHLDLVGLSGFATAYPGQLSGGMAQRVAIARALINRPRVLLLDEPFGALDAITRAHLQAELQRIVRQEGITAILVTHDVEEAVYLGDRVVVMHPHPGRIADVVPVDLADRRDRAAPAFIALRERILCELGVGLGRLPQAA